RQQHFLAYEFEMSVAFDKQLVRCIENKQRLIRTYDRDLENHHFYHRSHRTSYERPCFDHGPSCQKSYTSVLFHEAYLNHPRRNDFLITLQNHIVDYHIQLNAYAPFVLFIFSENQFFYRISKDRKNKQIKQLIRT